MGRANDIKGEASPEWRSATEGVQAQNVATGPDRGPIQGDQAMSASRCCTAGVRHVLNASVQHPSDDANVLTRYV